MSDAIIAGAVAGAIAGAIAAIAVVLVSRRSQPASTRIWRGQHVYTRSAAPAPPSGAPQQTAAEPRRFAGPFDRFNDRAKRVLALAQDEAIRLNHNYIGTEHLLLGLLRDDGIASRVLESNGVDLARARTAVTFIVPRGDASSGPSEITLSPRTKKIIELAIDESRRLAHAHVGPEHLLLGLVREGEGIACGVIKSMQVSLEKIRRDVTDEIARGGAGPSPSA